MKLYITIDRKETYKFAKHINEEYKNVEYWLCDETKINKNLNHPWMKKYKTDWKYYYMSVDSEIMNKYPDELKNSCDEIEIRDYINIESLTSIKFADIPESIFR